MPSIDTGRVALFYQDTGVGSGDAPPILLLHELGGSSESWAKTIPLLGARRRVVAVDFRCAGRSEKPVEPFALEALADDLAAVAGALGIGRFDVVGAALGSLVGAVLAVRHPRLVRRLAMFAVAPAMAGPTRIYLAERAALVRTVGMRGVAEASLNNAFPESHAAMRAEYRSIYLANDPNAYAELSLALARFEPTPADWGRIAVPTLVASGAQDFIWPPALGQQVAALIPGARCEILAEAGHFPHLQAPEALSLMAIGFFNG